MTIPALHFALPTLALSWLEVIWPTFAIAFFIVATTALVIFAFRMQKAFRQDEADLRRRVKAAKRG